VRRSSFQDRTKGGLDVDHRREWFVKRVKVLASIFAVQVSDFSIIDNQFHVILRNRPDLAATWTAREVTQRWQRLSRASLELKPLIGEKLLKKLSAKRKWVNERKRRLSSISWFMLMLKEPIARAANAEDGVRGHFFGERFQSLKLADDEQILITSLHVNSLAVRLGLAESVTSERFTAAHACLTGAGSWLTSMNEEAGDVGETRDPPALKESQSGDSVEMPKDQAAETSEPIAQAKDLFGAESAANGEANAVAEREIAADSGQRGAAARFQNASPFFQRLPLNVFCEWLETNACQGSVAAVSVPTAATGEADVRSAPPCADHAAGEAGRGATASVAEGQGGLPTPTLAVPDQLPATWERFGFNSTRWAQAVPLVSRRFRWLAYVAAAMRLDIRHWTGGS
jgi:hypothetical protein